MGYRISIETIFDKKDNVKWLAESFRGNKINKVDINGELYTPNSVAELLINILNKEIRNIDELYNSPFNAVKGNAKVLYKSLDEISAESSRKKAKPIYDGRYFTHTNENSEITILKICAASMLSGGGYIEFEREFEGCILKDVPKEKIETVARTIQKKAFCHDCGAELMRKDVAFCSECGAKQEKDSSTYDNKKINSLGSLREADKETNKNVEQKVYEEVEKKSTDIFDESSEEEAIKWYGKYFEYIGDFVDGFAPVIDNINDPKTVGFVNVEIPQRLKFDTTKEDFLICSVQLHILRSFKINNNLPSNIVWAGEFYEGKALIARKDDWRTDIYIIDANGNIEKSDSTIDDTKEFKPNKCVIVRNKGLYGETLEKEHDCIMNYKGNIVRDNYEYINSLYGNEFAVFASVGSSGKNGLLRISSGKQLLEPKYDYITYEHGNMPDGTETYVIMTTKSSSNGELNSCLNPYKGWIFKTAYPSIKTITNADDSWTNGQLLVCLNQKEDEEEYETIYKMGVADIKGNMLFEYTSYDNKYQIIDEKTCVFIKNKEGVKVISVDDNKVILSCPGAEEVYYLGEGYFKITNRDKQCGVYNIHERVFTIPYGQFDYIEDWRIWNGAIKVRKNDLYGFADVKGKILIPLMYKSIRDQYSLEKEPRIYVNCVSGRGLYINYRNETYGGVPAQKRIDEIDATYKSKDEAPELTKVPAMRNKIKEYPEWLITEVTGLVCEYIRSKIDNKPYVLFLKENDISEINRMIQCEEREKAEGIAPEDGLHMIKVANGYVANISVDLAQKIYENLIEELRKTNTEVKLSHFESVQECRNSSRVYFFRNCLNYIKNGEFNKEVILFADGADFQQIQFVDEEGRNYIKGWDAFHITTDDMEELNRYYLMPIGFRIKKYITGEILYNKRGVLYNLEFERIPEDISKMYGQDSIKKGIKFDTMNLDEPLEMHPSKEWYCNNAVNGVVYLDDENSIKVDYDAEISIGKPGKGIVDSIKSKFFKR